jgi:hypothetical protein
MTSVAVFVLKLVGAVGVGTFVVRSGVRGWKALRLLIHRTSARLSFPTELRALERGGLYSVRGEEGFRVAKLLVIEPDAIHICLYRDTFPSRPARLALCSQ